MTDGTIDYFQAVADCIDDDARSVECVVQTLQALLKEAGVVVPVVDPLLEFASLGWLGRGFRNATRHDATAAQEALGAVEEALRLRESIPRQRQSPVPPEAGGLHGADASAPQAQRLPPPVKRSTSFYLGARTILQTLLHSDLPVDRSSLLQSLHVAGVALMRLETTEAVTEAIATFEAIIEATPRRRMWRPMFFVRAAALVNVSCALNLLGTHTASLRSICFASEAIEDLDASAPVNDLPRLELLVLALLNKGTALMARDDAPSTAQAIRVLETAEQFLSCARQKTTSPRLRLARGIALNNVAFALIKEGSGDSVRRAIEAVNRALGVLSAEAEPRTHDTVVATATALATRCGALVALGPEFGPDSLHEASNAAAESIAVLTEARLSPTVQAQCALANGWRHKAAALIARCRTGATNLAQEAYDAAQQATTLSATLAGDSALTLEVLIESARLQCQAAEQLAVSDPSDCERLVEAIHRARTALACVREAELRGVRRFRIAAARLLSALGTLAAVADPEAALAMVLDNIDPRRSSGAMPETWQIHAAADETVVQTRKHLARRAAANQDPGTARQIESQLADSADVEARLAELRQTYFGEGVESTRLLATHYERSGDLDAARECWEEMVAFHPTDIGGYIGLAEWHDCHGSRDRARESLRNAISRVPECFSPRRGCERAQTVELVARLCQELTTIHVRASVLPGRSLEEIDRCFETARAELIGLKVCEGDPVAAQCARDGITAGLANVAERRKAWLRDVDASNKADRRLSAEHAVTTYGNLVEPVLMALAKDIPRTWQWGVETLRTARTALVRRVAQLRSEGHDDDSVIEMAATSLERVLSRVAESVQADGADDGTKQFMGLVGPEVFEHIGADARRELLFAERLVSEPDLAPFRGVAFGRTLEREMLATLFEPCRVRVRGEHEASRSCAFPFDASHSLETKLANFFAEAHPRCLITIGDMASSFELAILRQQDLHRPAFRVIHEEVVRTFVDPPSLLGLEHEAARMQCSNLRCVVELRNLSCHAHDPIASSDADRARDALIGPTGFLPLYVKARTIRQGAPQTTGSGRPDPRSKEATS